MAQKNEFDKEAPILAWISLWCLDQDPTAFAGVPREVRTIHALVCSTLHQQNVLHEDNRVIPVLSYGAAQGYQYHLMVTWADCTVPCNEATELNSTTNVYETMFRGYDAALGRFMQVDPLAGVVANHSPYHYAGNNPAVWNDPTGLLTENEFWNHVHRLMQAPYGGTWHADGTQKLFNSDADAARWAMGNYGDLGATEQHAYAKLQGVANTPPTIRLP